MTLKFLYTDDVTKRFSGTTLRTWLLFFAFYVFTMILIGICIAIVLGGVKPSNIPDWVLTFYTTLGIMCIGNNVFYLGKRINELHGGNVCTTESTNETR